MSKFRFRQDLARPVAAPHRQYQGLPPKAEDNTWRNEGAFSEAFAKACALSRLRSGELAAMAKLSPSATPLCCVACAQTLSREAVKEARTAAKFRAATELAICPQCEGTTLLTLGRLRDLGGGATVHSLLRFLYQRWAMPGGRL